MGFAKVPGLKWLLLVIPVLFVLVFMGYPLLGVLKLSVTDQNGFTLNNFIRIFQEPIYFQVIVNTLKVSFIVTVCALILGYPVAYLLTKTQSNQLKIWITAAVLLPYWTSVLVRTYAWTFMLQSNGIVNKLLMALGLVGEPVKLLHNMLGTTIGITHVLLPYMVLNLYAVMQGIDRNLVRAAEGMGSRPAKAFWTVFFPLSLPGVISGSLLVFVLSLGFLIIPAILGGPSSLMISTLIETQVNQLLNWNFGSAIAVVLLIITLLLTGISYLIVGKYPGAKELK
ncbi:ABC transporter permease [Paenibacillus eucommiae]|uniref:Spermidine/putrescine transport system permease protein/spermidine/putrescine transport system permease protein n=1 Tax=Paenibacillus eucommiae TaxID=1355755 RepID=A0ABS4J6H3_9BACL|nr:ABC transporter permease [Paenibacillus eucommiae]MBP1995400.1 putative spermidine/putrescine transport system permease protein/spermidine/putrescine transport system permease protein [Paenibacillus eucommiae]